MKPLLVVYCSMTGNTQAAAEAVAAGARQAGCEVILKRASEAQAEDLLTCGAAAFGSYDAFSYMGGELKKFFDRVFYPVRGKVADKPFAAFLTHGGKGQAIGSIEALATACALRKAAASVLVTGKPDPQAVTALSALGKALVDSMAE